MYLNDTNCCALSEITNLSDNIGNPKQWMKDFCRSLGMYGDKWTPTRNLSRYIGAFYMFTSVERIIGGSLRDRYDEEKLEANERLDPDDDEVYRIKYGSTFAKFIKDNKLGKVTVSPGRPNYLNHPTHVVKVYIWAPDREALVNWFTKNKE